MGTHHASPAYEKDNSTLWSLIWYHTEDGTSYTRIRNFRTSCGVRGALLDLIKNYKGDAYKNKERDNTYNMLKKGNYNKECP